MTDPLKAIQDAIGIHQEAHRIGYESGLREGLAKLDQAWVGISALTFTETGYAAGVEDCLEIIEKLGGMDPQKRSKE